MDGCGARQGTQEADEMWAVLKATQTIGTRSKLRLLVGGQRAWQPDMTARVDNGSVHLMTGRKLQQDGDRPGGAAFENITILLSVLLGVAGYMVQVGLMPSTDWSRPAMQPTTPVPSSSEILGHLYCFPTVSSAGSIILFSTQSSAGHRKTV
eukprot:SAG31_NODE_3343_length_4381_cov_12.838393_3_plen_152_part_00